MHHSNNTFIITCLVSHGWVLTHTNVLCRLLCFGTRFLNWFQHVTAVEQNTQDKIKEASDTWCSDWHHRDLDFTMCPPGVGTLSYQCNMCESCVKSANGPYCQTGSSSTRSGGLIDPLSLSTGITKLLLWEGRCLWASQYIMLIYNEFWKERFRFPQERLFLKINFLFVSHPTLSQNVLLSYLYPYVYLALHQPCSCPAPSLPALHRVHIWTSSLWRQCTSYVEVSAFYVISIHSYINCAKNFWSTFHYWQSLFWMRKN